MIIKNLDPTLQFILDLDSESESLSDLGILLHGLIRTDFSGLN